ncbi:MAG: NAD(P)H-dependent oxidoreductase [Acetobacteraceae bacterium]|nr:NAD(P)H-dependent oxidoreductase [Acetobacteraceae bacterium]MCX7685996.1 NAD(P)H-dependent oxidoreductase [Acetobacteraceae bacterium]
MTDILIAFHSPTGRTRALAHRLAEGVASVEGCNALLRRIGPEGPEPQATMSDLAACAGVAIGTPVHFAAPSTPVRAFLDQATELWLGGVLAGRPATAFCSAGSGGGREAALMSLWAVFASHGMVIVPLGGTHREMADLSAAHGASPFGAGSVSGPGERPNDVEALLARRQGEALARIARRLSG